ncbi:hypothetical protein AB2B38_005395 [Balneola sp. MJW-20]|uniref:hypothetical protein n=1 Tax=Gracilimonas aurantiaca TaxID=3234185 RepID=UPI0034AEA0DF
MVLVEHIETPERVYANIDIIMPYSGKKVLKPSGDYTRVIDWEEYKEPEQYAQSVNGTYWRCEREVPASLFLSFKYLFILQLYFNFHNATNKKLSFEKNKD